MAITASVQPESARMVYTRSILCQIRLPASVSVPFFQRRHGSYFVKPTRIRCGWSKSVFGQTHLDWKQAGAGIIGPGFWQDATGPLPVFPLSDSVPFLPQTSRIILCKTSRDPISFCLVVSGLGQTDPVRKQANVQESSGPLLANVSEPIRTGCE